MPYFEISLNDEPCRTIGGVDWDILTFGLISTQGSPTAYLQVTSMKKAPAEHEMLFSHQVERGGHLTVVFRGSQSDPVENVSNNTSKSTAPINEPGQFAGRIGFAVKMNNTGLVHAHVDDDSMLHVAATWIKAKDRCNFEVVCTRMNSEGQNQMFLGLELRQNQPFQIEVI